MFGLEEDCAGNQRSGEWPPPSALFDNYTIAAPLQEGTMECLSSQGQGRERLH